LPVVAAVAAGLLAGVRVISAEDLGYHLAYGNRFLESGHPVSHDEFLYTLPALDTPPLDRPAPGPGCWYDADGRYRFANANWLTQVFVAAAYQAGGVAGLNIELVLLVAMLLGLTAWLMHRLGVRPPVIGIALVALVLVSYTRLTLRPELFGYVALVAQACLLTGIWRHGRFRAPLSWAAVSGLIGLQLLFVNLHSYFLLGLALTGAVFVGSLGEKDATGSCRRKHLLRLVIAGAGQGLVCLVNPWTWRLAVLPLQTTWYLGRHHLADGPAAHPWTSMGDMQRTRLFDHGWASDIVALSFLVCLVAVAAAAVAAVRRRRWDWLLLIAGMTLVSFSAQRNLAVGMIGAVPFAMGALSTAPWWPALSQWCARCAARLGLGRVTAAEASRIAAAVLALPAVGLAISIVTNRLYITQDSPIRFGAGLSRLHLPIAAAKWIDDHEVTGRIWASPLCSSTVYGFVEPRPRLNMVTNTWAYPPAVMQKVLAATSTYGPQPFEPIAKLFDVSVVVAKPGQFLDQLGSDPRWVPVHTEGRFAVLVRRDGPDAHLAERHALTGEGLDAATLIQQARALDPAPGLALWLSARVLIGLGFNDHALQMLAASRADNPSEPRAWIGTANALSRRAAGRSPTDRAGVRADLEQTVEALTRAWALTGDPALAESVRELEQNLNVLDQHRTSADRTEPGAQP
jgi:hypothetical protein